MDYSSDQSHSSTVKSLGTGVRERVAQVYYKHGLFCSSHPYAVILGTLLFLAVCCYPLINIPLMGSSLQQFSTPVNDSQEDLNTQVPSGSPRWFQGTPVGIVQQVIVKSAVSPWTPDLNLMDAFRGPLAEVFQIVETVSNFHVSSENNSVASLSDMCLQVSEPFDKVAATVLPSFSCLLLSPANFWRQDFNRFQQDGNIIKTIYLQKAETVDLTSPKDILFGVPWNETNIKKILVRTRQRVITYAVTVVFHTYDPKFMLSLKKHLENKYPSSPWPENVSYLVDDGVVSHVYFEDQYTLVEYIPLGMTYVILFLYVYFSVRKIELVKSKWALAVSAVMTMVMSLLMSVGLCIWFGLNPTLNGSEIFPYLVVVIGLENMWVLTKSVVSTPVHLDVKVRVAQGLSKEGWFITKNLLTELTVLTFAFFTFVPAIQEFCLFAVVGVFSDFFLQMVFFATVLSIDIRRIELAELHKDNMHRTINIGQGDEPITDKQAPSREDVMKMSGMCRSRLRTPVVPYNTSQYRSVIAPPTAPILVKLPKRLRFIYFWARTRMVQRGLMVCLVVWIFLVLYKLGIMDHLTSNTTSLTPVITEQVVRPILLTLGMVNHTVLPVDKKHLDSSEHLTSDGSQGSSGGFGADFKLFHHNPELWRSLPPQHWSTLFGYYNISLSGRYLSVVPPIHLAIPISPSIARELRHPTESEIGLRAALQFIPGMDQVDQEVEDGPVSDVPYPSSPTEVAFALALSVPSILFIIYILIVLYRCMCSRNYAEWRSSWSKRRNKSEDKVYSEVDPDSYLIMETLPLKLEGHKEEIEYILTEEKTIISTCLAGDIRVWDALSGECLTTIIRSSPLVSKPEPGTHTRGSGSFSSDSTYGSSPTSETGDYFSVQSTYRPPGFLRRMVESSSQFVISQPSSQDDHFTGGFSFLPMKQDYDFSRASRTRDMKHCGKDRLTDAWKCHKRNQSDGNELDEEIQITARETTKNHGTVHHSPLSYQPLWCMDCQGGWLVLGCGGGRIEVWDAVAGVLRTVYEDGQLGVTCLQMIGRRLVVARLNGVLEFLQLTASPQHEGEREPSPNTDEDREEEIMCVWLQGLRAHTQPITTLVVEGAHVVSGSLDCLIKVFRWDSAVCVYTLHGHRGGITVLQVDSVCPTSGVSGCEEGMICYWDFLTGTCVYSLNAHRGVVLAVLTTSLYVISLGTDNRICIWEKYQGHLLHSVRQQHSLCMNLELLTDNIVVSAKEDHLVLWDVNHGEPLRIVMLGSGSQGVCVKQLRVADRAVVCDFGHQLCVIHFPGITEKTE